MLGWARSRASEGRERAQYRRINLQLRNPSVKFVLRNFVALAIPAKGAAFCDSGMIHPREECGGMRAAIEAIRETIRAN